MRQTESYIDLFREIQGGNKHVVGDFVKKEKKGGQCETLIHPSDSTRLLRVGGVAVSVSVLDDLVTVCSSFRDKLCRRDVAVDDTWSSG